jgi:hypothetical protein
MNSKWTAVARKATRSAVALCLVFAAVGCSSKSGTVTGKVTFKGQPVTGGTLTFSPFVEGVAEPGRPVSVEVKDGAYEASGVVPGRCRVGYVAPTVQLPEGYVPQASRPTPVSPYVGLHPNVKEVEVQAGETNFDIELVQK